MNVWNGDMMVITYLFLFMWPETVAEKNVFTEAEEEVNPLPRELEPARKTGAIPCEKKLRLWIHITTSWCARNNF